MLSVSLLRVTAEEKTSPVQTHLVRQDRSSNTLPLTAKREANEMTDAFSTAREGVYLLSTAREFWGGSVAKGQVPLNIFYRTFRANLRTRRLLESSI